MKKTLFKISLFVFFSLTLYSQSTHWQRYFPRGNDEEGYDICTASDGNIYTGGLTSDPRCGWLLKLNPYGDTIWTKRISQFDFIFAIEPTSDGGCIVAGDYNYVVKVNMNGDTIWTSAINGGNICGITKTNDGNYIVCGGSFNPTPFACKINETGVIIWQKDYSQINGGFYYTVINGIDNGYIFVGVASTPLYRGIIVKIDYNGNYLWQKQFMLNDTATYLRSIVTKHNGYLIAGTTGTYNYRRVFLIESNLMGDTINSRIFNSNVEEINPCLLKINENKYYLSNDNNPYSNTKIKIRSIDTNYQILNQLIINPIRDYVSCQKIGLYTGDNSGDLLLTGITDYFNVMNEELYAARIDSSLTQPPGIGIRSISSEIPNSFLLSQNYPNPFNPTTKIRFSLPYPSEGRVQSVKLIIYDMLGKEIAELIPPLWGGQGGLKPGTYEVTWDASNFPSGVYFYKLTAGDPSLRSGQGFTESKKMILIK